MGGDDASIQKRELLAGLAGEVGASLATWMDFGRDPSGGVRVLCSGVWGDGRGAHRLGRLTEHLPAGFFDDLSRFLSIDFEFSRWEILDRRQLPPRLVEAHWAPADISECASVSLIDDGVLMASLGIYTQSDRTFPEGALRRLRGHLARLVRLGKELFRQELARRPEAGEYLIGPDGGLRAGSPRPGGAPPPGLSELAVRFCRSGEARAVHRLDGAAVELRALRDERARVQALASVIPLEPLALPPLLRLPPATRRVVAEVAKGLSNEEVAVLLGRSIHTVRSHLKTAYDALGVTSRSELAGALYTQPSCTGGFPPPCAVGA